MFRGPVAYQRFLDWSASPWLIALNLVALAFLLYHAVTFINLAPPMLMRVLTDGALAPKRPVPLAARDHVLWVVVGCLFVQRLGTVGATHVRFLFGFPFALLFLAGVALFSGTVLPVLNLLS